MNHEQHRVRRATEVELGELPSIEAEADGMFLGVGIVLPQGQLSVEELRSALAVFVVGEPVVGFLCLKTLDGAAHLAQVAVRPALTRGGLGSALVAAAIEWARERRYAAITLTTYRDVPWNGPYYARWGFVELGKDELTSGLAACRDHERVLGLDDLGPRIAMRLVL